MARVFTLFCAALTLFRAGGLKVESEERDVQFPGMPSIPGVPAEIMKFLPPIDQVLKIANDAALLLKKDSGTVGMLHLVMRQIKSLTNMTLRQINADVDRLMLAVKDKREPAEVAPEVEKFFRDAVPIFSKLGNVLVGGVRKEVLPFFPGVYNFTDPALAWLDTGVDFLANLSDNHFSKFSNMSTEGLCEQVAPLMHPEYGLPAAQRYSDKSISMLEQVKGVLPLGVPVVLAPHPELVQNATDVVLGFVEVGQVIGHAVAVGSAHFVENVGPLMVNKLSCDFSPRYENSGAMAFGPRVALVAVLALVGLTRK